MAGARCNVPLPDLRARQAAPLHDPIFVIPATAGIQLPAYSPLIIIPIVYSSVVNIPMPKFTCAHIDLGIKEQDNL